MGVVTTALSVEADLNLPTGTLDAVHREEVEKVSTHILLDPRQKQHRRHMPKKATQFK